MSATDDQVREQVQQLRTALETARGQLIEQKEMLDQLTSPPYTYATVVAVSSYKPNPRLSETTRFTGVSGDTIDVNPIRSHFDEYTVGDRLSVRLHARVRSEILQADELIVVGFDDFDRVVVQLDGKLCFIDGTWALERNFEIEKNPGDETDETVVITIEGKLMEILQSKETPAKPGDTVKLSTQTMQIVGVAETEPSGQIGYVRRVIDDELSEVDYESGVRVVWNGKTTGLDKGDRVVLDSSAVVIVKNLGKDDERFSFTAETNVSWEDIGGLEDAKRQMVEAVELPHTNAELFRFYGKKPIKGVLLYGPPGCGKTMLGKATATALAKIYSGKGNSSGFIYIKGPEILDRFVGVAEATIRQIFARARKHKETHGYPAVVFIDEADAILAKRGSGVSSDMERTIVPMFLTEMDGLEDSGALVILATNRSDILDPAVVRDGRIDRKIKIDRPDLKGVMDIFKLNLHGLPLNNGYTYGELAELGANELFSPSRVLFDLTMREGGMTFNLGNVVNGGMIAGIVDQATSFALHRDLSAHTETGLTKEDVKRAVDSVERQNRDLNHTDELTEFVHDFREDVVSVKKRLVAANA